MALHIKNEHRLDDLAKKTDILNCAGVTHSYIIDFAAGPFTDLASRGNPAFQIGYIDIVAVTNFTEVNVPVGLLDLPKDSRYAAFSICHEDHWGVVVRIYQALPKPFRFSRQEMQAVTHHFNMPRRSTALPKALRSHAPAHVAHRHGERRAERHGTRASMAMSH